MSALSRRTFGIGTLAVGLAGASRRARAQEEPRYGGTLVATLGDGEPQACYVPSGGGPSPTFSASKLLERLAYRRMDGDFEGELAESWQPAADFRSYTVKLRKGIAFHDGTEMTAADVVYSVNEIWKPHADPLALATFVGIDAAAADTVVFKFSEPTPAFFFASLLSGSANYVLPKHVYGGGDPVGHAANNAPIGTGPWKFQRWVRGSHFEFVRNDRYWRKGFPYLDRLILRYVRDPAGRAAALEAGEIQIGVLTPVALPDIKRLTATGKVIATSKGYEERVWATTLECNLRHPILARREVRQALFHAIDRQVIVDAVYAGYARAGTGPIFSPNTAFFVNDLDPVEFAPGRATALLDKAGLARKGNAPRFTLDLVAGGWFADNGRVGAYVKQALEDVGIGVSLSMPDRASSIRRIYSDYDFDLAISNQSNPSEPVPITTQYYTTDGIRKGVPFCNASGYSNPELDALVERIKVETDASRRKELVVEFQKVVVRDAPLLPLVEFDTVTLASIRVRNHSTVPDFAAASWHDVWLAD
ncbi:MAG: ABC transporter substrate-binding protein [Proteobacteria bacterium]|nr:ABC transporter substrate-binding protein [Pseudomonadota bacterium]